MFIAWDLPQTSRLVQETSRLQSLRHGRKDEESEARDPEELVKAPSPIELELVEPAGDGSNSRSNVESNSKERHGKVSLDGTPDVGENAWRVGQGTADERPAEKATDE